MGGFNPRTPCGVRPFSRRARLKLSWFQSTHSLRSATHDRRLGDVNYLVSIHALLAECDVAYTQVPRTGEVVSIHALLAECDYYEGAKRFAYIVSIHALLAECDPKPDFALYVLCVSIHALLAECDRIQKNPLHYIYSFNPRTPCGVRQIRLWLISRFLYSFNPRTPCGVRLA